MTPKKKVTSCLTCRRSLMRVGVCLSISQTHSDTEQFMRWCRNKQNRAERRNEEESEKEALHMCVWVGGYGTFLSKCVWGLGGKIWGHCLRIRGRESCAEEDDDNLLLAWKDHEKDFRPDTSRQACWRLNGPNVDLQIFLFHIVNSYTFLFLCGAGEWRLQPVAGLHGVDLLCCFLTLVILCFSQSHPNKNMNTGLSPRWLVLRLLHSRPPLSCGVL